MPTYALVMRLEAPEELSIGALGRHAFRAGYYVYVGSAARGLWPRLARHLRRQKPLHWHADYLTTVATPVEAWIDLSAEDRECLWARLLLQSPGASLPVRGFGASDCRCGGHLAFFRAKPSFEALLTHGG